MTTRSRVEQGWESRSACRCVPSPATHAPPSESGSSQRFQAAHDPKQHFHVHAGLDDDPAAIHAHHFHAPASRFWTLLRLLWYDHRRYETADATFAKAALAMRLAPGKQQLVGNPVAPRRRRCLSRSRTAFLDDPQLLLLRPAAPAASVNNLETSDLAIVSRDIHTDSQLHPPFAGKTVLLGRVRSNDLVSASFTSVVIAIT